MFDFARTAPPPLEIARQRGDLARQVPSIIPSIDFAKLLRRWWLLCLCLGLLGGAAAYVLGGLIPPRFTATAEIYIDPRGLQIFDNDLTPRQQDANAAINFVESQSHVMTSRSVLQRVVQEQGLATDPEFGGPAVTGGETLLSRLGLREPSPIVRQDTESGAIAALGENIAVSRAERTFVIDLTLRAHSADKAASLVNALAAAYIDEEASTRAQTAQRTTDLLTGRLADLREKLRLSEQRAEEFRRQNGLIGTRLQLSSEQQLTDAVTSLAGAQSRLAQAQARFGQVATARRSGNLGGLDEAVASPTMAALRGQQTQAEAALADMSDELGPRHPSVRKARARVAEIERRIGQELARIAQAASANLERAKAERDELQLTLDRRTQQAATVGESSIELRQLEQEVEANRALVATFEQRSRQTSEFARFDSSNTRIISPAMPPRTRSFPPRNSVLAVGGVMGGLMLAALIALLSEMAGARTSRSRWAVRA